MKKLSKVLIVISVIVASLYGYYQYKLHQYYQIKPQDEKYLKEKVFGNDSENRGYSDEAKRQIEEDLSPLFNNPSFAMMPASMSSEKYMPIDPVKLKRIYELKYIQERKNVLSNSQEEYIAGFIKWKKLMKCLGIMSNHSVDFKNMHKTGNAPESPRMNEMIDIVHDKYTKRLSLKENIALIRTMATREECEAFSNE